MTSFTFLNRIPTHVKFHDNYIFSVKKYKCMESRPDGEQSVIPSEKKFKKEWGCDQNSANNLVVGSGSIFLWSNNLFWSNKTVGRWILLIWKQNSDTKGSYVPDFSLWLNTAKICSDEYLQASCTMIGCKMSRKSGFSLHDCKLVQRNVHKKPKKDKDFRSAKEVNHDKSFP